MLRSVLGYIGAIKWSVLSFVLFLIGGFASLGMLGMALYGVAFPVISMFYPPLDDWNGPWVWPVLIAVGLIWPFSFFWRVRLATRSSIGASGIGRGGWRIFSSNGLEPS